MFAVIYGILGDDSDGELFIDGPFYYACHEEFPKAEILARELASTKTKNQIIPWVFEVRKNETIAHLMERTRDGWYKRFKSKTIETFRTMQKDQTNSTCPFNDICINQYLENYLN